MESSLEACTRAASEEISYMVCPSPFHGKYLLEVLNGGGRSTPRVLCCLFQKTFGFAFSLHSSGIHVQTLDSVLCLPVNLKPQLSETFHMDACRGTRSLSKLNR